MKEHKIRAWDGKRMLYKDLYDLNWYSEPSPNGKLVREVVPNDARNLQTMFHTGLRDKNGKEVYEGDCLGGFFEHGYIGYCNQCMAFQLFDISEGCQACAGDLHWNEVIEYRNQLDVIGNLYETPELLE